MILVLAASAWLVAFGMSLARRRTNDAWQDVLAVGVIGVATAGFFWRLLAGQVWMPAGGGDLAQFLYPTFSFAAEWWRRGVIPLWNPYLFAGMPFVGDIQSGILYPVNLLTFLISVPLTFRDMEFLSILHFFIAGAGMYAFLRLGKWRVASAKPQSTNGVTSPVTCHLSRFAALAGALAFEFSDLFITHFGNLNLIAVAAWLPLILLFYRRAATDRRSGFAAIAGILLAVSFLAGHPQIFLFNVMALALFALYQTIVIASAAKQSPIRDLEIASSPNASRLLAMTSSGRRSVVGYFYPMLLLAVVGLVAIGFSAPVLVPSVEMAQNTVRANYSYEQATQFSLPPAQLIGLFVPGFFGRGPQNAWGPWSRVEVGYLGILPILLAFLALVLRRDSATRFFGAFALIGLAFALGGYAILHGWLYQLVPGFGQLRVPARFIVLMDFAFAVLAAFGFDGLLRSLPRASEIAFKHIVRAAPWAFLLIAIPAGVLAYSNLILGQGQDAALFTRIANATNALAFFILLFALSLGLIVARGTRFFRPKGWAVLALALVFFDLFSLGAYVDLSTDDPTRVYERPDAVAYLKSVGGVFRVDPRETGVDNTWPPDMSILHGFYDINGDNPLVLADFDRYWQSLGSRSSPLYDLLNTRFLIGRKNVPLDRAKFQLAFDGDPALDVFENTRALPRAFVVFNARVVPDHVSALDAIHAPDFDPAMMVVVETTDDRRPLTADNSQSSAVSRQPSAVEIVGYAPNEIWLDTNTAMPGILFLSEVYYPGWRTFVDDREIEILRADYLFRALELPAGAHRVRMVYDPPSFKVGVGLFALTVAALVVWSVRVRIAKRKQ